jgi:hypothetical protein
MGIYRQIVSPGGDVTFNSVTTNTFTSSGSTNSTASYAITSSYALTASYLLGSSGSSINASVLATTGSNIFIGNQTITGSIYLNSGSLFGTASYTTFAISSSYPISVTGSTLYSVSPLAGYSNTNNSIFFGSNAGAGAPNAFNSIFLGQNAGLNAYNANNSNFLGYNTGVGVFNGSYSNFIGNQAGYQATNARYSVFIGDNTGYQATNASYSILLGHDAGKNISGSGMGSNNIVIGSNITLANDRKDSINLGGIIFATGSYNILSSNPYSGSVSNGRVGIGISIPQTILDVTSSFRVSGGSNRGQLTVYSDEAVFIGPPESQAGSALLRIYGQGTNNGGVIYFGYNSVYAGEISTINSGRIQINPVSESVFMIGGIEKMRLNSNGNLVISGSTSGADLGYKVYIDQPSVSGSLNVSNTLYVSASRVGVGTSSPSYSLDVNGYIKTSNGLIVGNELNNYVTTGFHKAEIVASGTQTPLVIGGGSGVVEIWKNVNNPTPDAASAFGMAVPGSALTNDFIMSTFSGSTWTERMRVINSGTGSGVSITGSLTTTGNATIQGLTANRALTTNANDQLVSSATTDTELGYISGVTSAVQTQIDSKGYTLALTSVAGNLASGTTYYFGNVGRSMIANTTDVSKVYIPKTGTIKKAYITSYSTTTGTITSITVNIRLNNTTDTLVASSTASANFRTYNNNSLSIAVTEGEYIEMKVTSTSSLAPTGNIFSGTLYIE